MSYAIIRIEKYKRSNLNGIYRHNERKNTNYSNNNIDSKKTQLNYHIKECSNASYESEFEDIKEKQKLQGQIKEVSNIACEYIITSDNEFFHSIGTEETKRFFEEAYNFACNYQNLGKDNVISAVVHLDEDTPHMHLMFIPVVQSLSKDNAPINKIACSEFWKGKNSYSKFQDSYYSYITSKGFKLERGVPSDIKHVSVQDYKKITNFDKVKELAEKPTQIVQVKEISEIKKMSIDRDTKIDNEIIQPLKKQVSKLVDENIELKTTVINTVKAVNIANRYELENKKLTKENIKLHKENNNLYKELSYFDKVINTLENTIDKIFTWFSKVFKLDKTKAMQQFQHDNDRYLDYNEEINKSTIQYNKDEELESEI